METIWNVIPRLFVWAFVTVLGVVALRLVLYLFGMQVSWGVFEVVNTLLVRLFGLR